jgi:hypothetical protein
MNKAYVVIGGWNHENYSPDNMRWFTNEMEAEAYAQEERAKTGAAGYDFVDIFVSEEGQPMELI